MRRRKSRTEPAPEGCRTCMGAPWVMAENGMRRCTCPRGTWYKQQDRRREPYATEQLQLEGTR